MENTYNKQVLIYGQYMKYPCYHKEIYQKVGDCYGGH